MREAMAAAAVGDDVYGEDPTVNRLQERGAALIGKRAALFVPSGTLGNQLCLRALAEPGREVIVDAQSHIVRYEQGAAGALAGLQLHWVQGARGLMTADQVEAAIRPKDPYTIQSALICLENTHNAGGGTVYPLATIQAIRAVAKHHGLPMHLDGARLFNAVVASGTSATEYARPFDTVTFCLSKGLGAPAGSLIATDDASLWNDSGASGACTEARCANPVSWRLQASMRWTTTSIGSQRTMRMPSGWLFSSGKFPRFRWIWMRS
ncbi:MAG: hypothetical protein AMXMBFR67_22860 [Nitrospira sp.]